MRGLKLFTAIVFLAAGCSAFPGLRVLTGEDTGEGPVEIQNIPIAEMVMADKTGATDPSLMAAANRIEAATSNMDVIEIRKDELNDMFIVNMLYLPPQNLDLNTQAGVITLYSTWQRALEVTWQGTLKESEGSGTIQVNLLLPFGIETLDSGPSFLGYVDRNSEIERGEVISYLSGPHDLNDFVDLIVTGTLHFESPLETVWYEGQPNHPLVLLDQLQPLEGGA